jgi:HKD family nuclease
MARSIVRLHAIDNKGPNNLRQFLRDAGKKARQIDIASAFVTASGLRSIRYVLQRAAKKGTVRVLTGFYQRFTEPAALRSLLKLARNSRGTIEVRISAVEHFHWKAYLVRNGSILRVAVGSSNLTDMGLCAHGELNVVATASSESGALNRVLRSFNNAWGCAKQLSPGIIERYARHRQKAAPVQLPRLPLRQILQLNGESRNAQAKQHRRYWRTWVDGHIAKSTQQILDQEVDWGRHFVLNGLPNAEVGDHGVLFDFMAKRLLIIEIIDTTETSVSTPDGRFFQAYRVLWRKHYKRLRPALFKTLKVQGLIKRKDFAYRTSALSEATFKQYLEMLKL